MLGDLVKLVNNIFGALRRHGAKKPLKVVNATLEAINGGDPHRVNIYLSELLDKPIENRKPGV
jgi:hypothetical protein